MPTWSIGVLAMAIALLLGCGGFLAYVRSRERAGIPVWTTLDADAHISPPHQASDKTVVATSVTTTRAAPTAQAQAPAAAVELVEAL